MLPADGVHQTRTRHDDRRGRELGCCFYCCLPSCCNLSNFLKRSDVCSWFGKNFFPRRALRQSREELIPKSTIQVRAEVALHRRSLQAVDEGLHRFLGLLPTLVKQIRRCH